MRQGKCLVMAAAAMALVIDFSGIIGKDRYEVRVRQVADRFVGSDVSEDGYFVDKNGKRVSRDSKRPSIPSRSEAADVLIHNALKRGGYQGGDTSADGVAPIPCTFVQAVATMSAGDQETSKVLTIAIEKYDQPTNTWKVLTLATRNSPSPGSNLSVGVFTDSGFLSGGRYRATTSSIETVYHGIDLNMYVTPPPDPE